MGSDAEEKEQPICLPAFIRPSLLPFATPLNPRAFQLTQLPPTASSIRRTSIPTYLPTSLP